jgi:NAD(P)-dependent dehydrogenase (short-subunit alcohol dehydrogenase family)
MITHKHSSIQSNIKQGTVIITGGSRGIGRATAFRLSELGFDVIVTWNSSKKKASEVVEKIVKQGNFAAHLQLRLEHDDIHKKFKEIDSIIEKPIVGLVNNAAINEGRNVFTQKSLNDWEKVFRVNVFSLVELCKAVFERMALSKGGKGGSIVNLSSQVATFGANQLLAYVASKGAVNAITIALAKEVGVEGIRVNAVSPGLINTGDDQFLNKQLQAKISQIPLGRIGTAQDVGELVSWLISTQSAFISGAIIPIHGAR